MSEDIHSRFHETDKVKITKKSIIDQLRGDIKILTIFQLVGAVTMLIIIVNCFTQYLSTQSFEVGYLVICVIIALIFILIPFRVKSKQFLKIKDIKENRYRVIKDTVKGKTSEAHKDKTDGDYRWEYILEGHSIGRLPELNKSEWELSEVGDEVYVLVLSNGDLIKSFPKNIYELDEEMSRMIVTGREK